MTNATSTDSIHPPIAPRRVVLDERHGQRREDPYAWLRDANWRDAMADPQRLDPAIRSYLEAENRYAEAMLADVEPLRRQLVDELRGRIREDDSSVPAPDGPWAYYSRFREGGQHALLCRRPRDGGDEQILFDGDAEAAGSEYFRLGGASHSADHRWLAYAVDRTGAEAFEIRFRDLTTGEDLDEVIEQARGDLVWAADHQTLLYTVLDEAHRPRWVYRHRLGTPPGSDECVYTETDPGFPGRGSDRKRSFFFFICSSTATITPPARCAGYPPTTPASSRSWSPPGNRVWSTPSATMATSG